MTLPFIASMKHYKAEYLPKDVMAGVVVAALTIPIALGYAQVAGLPAIYGLYGSMLPLLVFALFTSSPNLVFGMDAAGSAITGSVLMGAGVVFQSTEALTMVPLISLMAGIWLLLFALLKVGKFVNFVSLPVMGGFITGIAVSIMAGQVVQMAGVPFSHGEFLESLIDLLAGLVEGQVVLWSVALGLLTVAVLETFKRVAPKVPMVLFVLVGAIIAAECIDFDSLGVASLGELSSGLPSFGFPLPTIAQCESALTMSLMVAVVVAIESILADNNFAQKDGYRLDDNREIASFGVGNLLAGLCGASPASASVSRTAAAKQYDAKTQLSNVVAVVCILVVCLFFTPYLSKLPQPVLAGIVFSALCSVVELPLAARLRRVSRAEFWVFVIVMGSVLLVGIIFGVAMGVLMSFFLLLRKSLDPPRYFIGVVPGTNAFASVRPDSSAQPIVNIVYYRFAGSLFFANCETLRDDIDAAVTDKTKAIFLDASMISSVDVSAGDRLASLINSYEQRGIPFYLIGMDDIFSRQITRYEIEMDLSKHAHIAPTAVQALEHSGLTFEVASASSQEDQLSKQA